MIDKEFLTEISAEYGFSLNEDMTELFNVYAKELTEWNQKINLTAITEPKEICIKHFLDSLLLLKSVEIPKNARLIDVGTGAGFPSAPCGIYRADLEITMLDSLNKRISFLKELSHKLGLNASCVHARAEDAGRDTALREKFDVAAARAVAHLRELSEYCIPFVKPGGYFTALKGSEIETELNEAKPAIKLLGGKVEKVVQFELPDDMKRSIVVIKKISQTPTKYPRMTAKIKKQPIK